MRDRLDELDRCGKVVKRPGLLRRTGRVRKRVFQSIPYGPQRMHAIVEFLFVVNHQKPDEFVRCCKAFAVYIVSPNQAACESRQSFRP